MKKLLSLVSSIVLSAALISFVPNWQAKAETWSSISGTSDWLAMPGNEVNGTAKPSKIALSGNGLTVTYTGGEYTPGGSNAGVMYAHAVDLKNFSVEFTVTKKAGDYNLQGTGVDSWISLCLLNKSTAYFNVNKAGQSQGIVTLIRPMGSTTAFEINQLTNSWSTASRRSYPFPGKMTTTFTVQIKKNSSGTYDYIVNGKKVDLTQDGGSEFTSAFTTLMEKGGVYFYMGVSSKDSSQQIEWKISKINGKAVTGSGSVATTSSSKSSSGSVTSSAPKSGNTTAKQGTGSTANVTGSTVAQDQSNSSALPSETMTADSSDTSGSLDTTSSAESSSVGASNSANKSGTGVGIVIAIVLVVLLGGGAAALLICKKKGLIFPANKK